MKRVKATLLFLVSLLILMTSLPAFAAEVLPNYYIRRDATNQDSTAYLSTPGDSPAAGGNYYVGLVAVHPSVPGGNPLNPIIPFGTVIWLTSPSSITIQGTSYNHFDVRDTGDLNYSKHPSSSYWIDIYFGEWNGWDKTDPDYQAAISYGNANKVSYYWYEWVN